MNAQLSRIACRLGIKAVLRLLRLARRKMGADYAKMKAKEARAIREKAGEE